MKEHLQKFKGTACVISIILSDPQLPDLSLTDYRGQRTTCVHL